MLFLRIFQHLLPDSVAWRLTGSKRLKEFFAGLAGVFGFAVAFLDQVFADAFPDTTRNNTTDVDAYGLGGSGALEEFERQFGLEPNGTEIERRQSLAAEWAAGGGQSAGYIEGILQTAGFDVYVHEWWSSGPPYVARDPRLYTTPPLFGTWRCGGSVNVNPGFASGPTCSAFSTQPRCNRFLNNDPHYLVNKDLTRRAPPPIPNDPAKWPYFMYVGAETFPEIAFIPAARQVEFERLILKLRPLHLWIVTRTAYADDDDSFLLTEAGEPIATESNDLITV